MRETAEPESAGNGWIQFKRKGGCPGYGACSRPLLPAEAGKSVQPDILPVAQFATVVAQSVGQHHVARPQHRIVTDGLRKRPAFDLHVRRLALGKQQRPRGIVHNHHIGPLRLPVERYGILLYDARGLRPATGNQAGDQMLANPLFGSENQIDASQGIPHLNRPVPTAGPQPDGWKIEFGKSVHRSLKKIPYLYRTQIYELMRTILATIAFFSLCGLCAQEYVPTCGRELPRGELLAYPSAEAAEAADGGDNRYFTRLEEWNLNGNSFSTNFTVPFAWANRQVLLHIGQASGEYELRINDREAAYVADGNAPAEFNITKLVREGRNTVEIRVVQPSPSALLESWKENPEPMLGGIWLLSQPTLRIRDVATKTRIGENGNATAEVALVIKSEALNPRTSRIHYQLLTPTGENAATGHKDITLAMRGEDTLRFLARIPANMLWSPELPTQYTLRLKTQHEGRYVEYAELRLGFRAVEVRDERLLLNGQPASLRIREVPATISENEIAALREQGYNTLKLLPGPVSESFLNSCDGQGLCVIVQAPIDTSRSGDSRQKEGNPSNDPAWLQAYLERTENSYHTTKRHPSVIAFSLATQSANGINLYESYLNMTRFGDSRPFIYPNADGEWNSDRVVFE